MTDEEDFQLPSRPPQFDSPPDPITQQMLAAPAWCPQYGLELLIVCRNNPAVRSAIMFAMELAVEAEKNLRVANTIEEVKFLQGQLLAYDKYATTIINIMAIAEQPKEQDDELVEEE